MRHSNLEGSHAFLGASKYSWLNYNEDKLTDAYYNFLATQRGNKLHEIAAQLITEKIILPKNQQTFKMSSQRYL